MSDDDLRQRYAEAIAALLDKPNGMAYRDMLPAALLAVRDDELADLQARVEQAEAIIRAQNTLQIAMYNSDFEAAWPTKAVELEAAYNERYGVDLDGEE